jgi:hypothetical protein
MNTPIYSALVSSLAYLLEDCYAYEGPQLQLKEGSVPAEHLKALWLDVNALKVMAADIESALRGLGAVGVHVDTPAHPPREGEVLRQAPDYALFLRNACHMSLDVPAYRYLGANSGSPADAAVRSDAYQEMCQVYVGVALRWMPEDDPLSQEALVLVQSATQGMMGNMKSELGFSHEEWDPSSGQAPLFLDAFHDRAMSALLAWRGNAKECVHVDTLPGEGDVQEQPPIVYHSIDLPSEGAPLAVAWSG